MSSKDSFQQLRQWLASQVIGQADLIERLMIALLADGHLLVEGAPGLAKTRAIKALSEGMDADFHRIQFTPDLLPADITGSDIYRPEDGSFVYQQGPIFHNLVLADEINRAPAKVQAALLEAMAERQVSVGKQSYQLPEVFLVMATQNPIEQEGTFPLPEAQLDRFLLHVEVGYPDAEAEKQILELTRNEALHQQQKPDGLLNKANILEARKQVLEVQLADNLAEYIVQLVIATRNSKSDAGRWLAFGASPRASIALDRTARARAWLHGRDYVSPEDIQQLAYDVLRHRIITHFEADAQGISKNSIISTLLDSTPLA